MIRTVRTAVASVIFVATSASAAPPSTDSVYGFCTVRDITFDGDEGYSGKVYRTEIFSALRSYDSAISMKPMIGGKESATLERWLGRKYGFRPDRTGDPTESQHYCIEAPFTEAGEQELRTLHKAWDQAAFPDVSLLRVPWVPMEATLIPDPGPGEEYRRRLAEAKASEERNIAEASAARARTQQTLADHAARVAAAEAEHQRNQQAYREEYKRLTGRDPD